MASNIISISREFGSLGRPIAKKVAMQLGYKYYDRYLIDKEAIKMGEDIEGLLKYDINALNSLEYEYEFMKYPLGFDDNYKQKRLFEIERRTMIKLAEQDKCVFVGRCSDYVFSKEKNIDSLNIFIFAPYSNRYNFCLNNLSLTEKAVAEHIEKTDKARRDFYRRITGKKFDSLDYRNLMINSSSIHINDIVKLICISAELKFKQ